METRIRAMVPGDHPAVLALWLRTPGVGLSDSDGYEGVAAFLGRNPGMSAVAHAGSELVGAVLCGHDGRRGYLHHLAVPPEHRRRGVARGLLERCLAELAQRGIPKCNIFLFDDNEAGAAFWLHNGWISRDDLRVLQRFTASPAAGAGT